MIQVAETFILKDNDGKNILHELSFFDLKLKFEYLKNIKTGVYHIYKVIHFLNGECKEVCIHKKLISL